MRRVGVMPGMSCCCLGRVLTFRNGSSLASGGLPNSVEDFPPSNGEGHTQRAPKRALSPAQPAPMGRINPPPRRHGPTHHVPLFSIRRGRRRRSPPRCAATFADRYWRCHGGRAQSAARRTRRWCPALLGATPIPSAEQSVTHNQAARRAFSPALLHHPAGLGQQGSWQWCIRAPIWPATPAVGS
jgi:hypothetical protein